MDKKENIETAQVKEEKYNRDLNGWDVFFFVLPIISIIFGRLAGFEYLRTRYNSFSAFFVALILYPAIGVFIITCAFAGIVRLFVNWTKHTRMKRLTIIAQIGIVTVLIVLFFAPCFFPIDSHLWVPGYKPFTYHLRERMRTEADIPAIRSWLRTLSKEDCTGETIRLPYTSNPLRRKWPGSIGWPKSLKIFNPGYVELDLDKNSNPKVRLTWGGPPGHWGVEIGMEDMEIPPSDFSQFGEYRLTLEPGVYVWYELQ